MRMLPNHPKQYIHLGLVPMLQDLAIHLIETLTDNLKRIHSTLIFALKKTGRCSGLIVSKTFGPFKLVSENHSPCQCFTMWRAASSSIGPNDCHTHHQIDYVASRTTLTQLLYISWNISSTHTVGAYRKYAGFILTAQCIGGMPLSEGLPQSYIEICTEQQPTKTLWLLWEPFLRLQWNLSTAICTQLENHKTAL